LSFLRPGQLDTVKLGIAIGIVYFLAARLGLALRAEGVAVFWPAAGVAVGALCAFGASARLPVSAGVIGATAIANVMIGRNIWLSTTIGIVNAGESLLTAWLIGRWFGSAFKLDDVRQVLGFLAASAIGAGGAAVGGAAAISLFLSMSSPLDVWRVWFGACLLGTVTVTPLLIGLAEAVRVPPPRRELIEGAIALSALGVLSAYLILLPQGPWESALPVVLVFPVLLWVTVRCRPVFAAAAAFIVAVAIVLSATSSVGHFGDASIPLADRVLAAQTHVLAGALVALVLAALFADRRRSEAALTQSHERLQLALEGAELGVWSVDAKTGHFENDARDRRIHGHHPTMPPTTLEEARKHVHLENLADLEAAFMASKGSSGSYKVEYRLAVTEGRPAGQERWVAVEGTAVRDAKGRTVRLLGVTRDITERKQAELALDERNAQLALAGKAALVGSYVYEADLERMKVSEGYAAMHGLPEGTTETTRSQWCARVHPDDLAHMEALRRQTFADGRCEYNVDYRIVRACGEIRWIEARSFISYDSEKHPQRIVGVNIDVTQRKRTEALLRESEARYRALYNDNPSMYFTVDAAGTVLSVNQFGAQALGYTDAELVGQPVLKVIHAEDWEAARQQLALCVRNPSKLVKGEIRKVHRDGSVLWVRESARAVRDPDGRTVSLIVCEDITERKRAETSLKEGEARLQEALTAGKVMAFEWDAVTGQSRHSGNADRILGLAEGSRFLSQVHVDDRVNLKAHIRGLSPGNPSYALVFRFFRSDGRQVWLEETANGEFGGSGRLLRIKGLTRDITERKELEDHKNALVSELDHRVKNVLATVSAVASRTQETSSSMADFVAALDGRIKSMATTHELLSSQRWWGIPLAELVRRELAPYATTDNTRIDGPDVVLRAEAGQTLAMVFHELATNAAKFGALSVGSGRVSVRWCFRRNGHVESHLAIQWEESGGPEVEPPTRSGFGTSIVHELIPYELGGSVDLVHAHDGVRCNLEIPAPWLSVSNLPGEASTDILLSDQIPASHLAVG
jgi:PAS domain S-box-containing protein